MRTGRSLDWRRLAYWAGALLALAAVVVVVSSALTPAPATSAPTVIAISGPTPAPSSPAPARAPGTARLGGVVVDQADPTAIARLAAVATGTVPAPIPTGPLNGLDGIRWLLLWPFLAAVAVGGTVAAASHRRPGVPEPSR